MKFSCSRCRRRFSTAEEPVPGRMYRIPCKCGNTIVVQLDPPRAKRPSPPPLPFRRVVVRPGPPPLPSGFVRPVASPVENALVLDPVPAANDPFAEAWSTVAEGIVAKITR